MSNLQGTLRGPAKLEAVTTMMSKLSEDLKSNNLHSSQRDALLEELKLYGRDPINSDPIFTREGIETLTRHAFDSRSDDTSRNALRVLCNAMFLRPATRQMFVDLGYEAKVCNKLKSDNPDDEFLVSRLIFFTTYDTTINLVSLVDQHQLADTIVQNLARHAKRISGNGSNAIMVPMNDMALTETLKLLFNVTHFAPTRTASFTPAIPHILAILDKHDPPPPSQPLAPPFGPLINALMNLEVDDKDARSSLYPANESKAVAERTIQLLDSAMTAYTDEELEVNTTPLISTIMTIHEHAPEDVRNFIRGKLLPTEEDRKQVLGRGNSLTSRLLRNSTNAMTPKLREAISHLLFDMSDRNASKFVQNVGYGFASGFLFQNNIAVPESAWEAYSSSSGAERPINAVTGQFIDSERPVETPEMTQEEKEREAERLFVLFERLRRTGVVNVENPVETALQEGRVEELSGSSDSDDDKVG